MNNTPLSDEQLDFEIGKAMAEHFAKQFNYHIDKKIDTGVVDFQGIALPFISAKSTEIAELRAEIMHTCGNMTRNDNKAIPYQIGNKVIALEKELDLETARLNWLDKNCSFVADEAYIIGPYKVGQLRQMADDGIEIDNGIINEPTDD